MGVLWANLRVVNITARAERARGQCLCKIVKMVAQSCGTETKRNVACLSHGRPKAIKKFLLFNNSAVIDFVSSGKMRFVNWEIQHFINL